MIDSKKSRAQEQLDKTASYCKSCNAGYDNSTPRIMRCMTCVVLNGALPPTKWGQK
jgi:hypothetical protein